MASFMLLNVSPSVRTGSVTGGYSGYSGYSGCPATEPFKGYDDRECPPTEPFKGYDDRECPPTEPFRKYDNNCCPPTEPFKGYDDECLPTKPFNFSKNAEALFKRARDRRNNINEGDKTKRRLSFIQ